MALELGIVTAWALLLAGILLAPGLGLHSAGPGEDLTRNTVRLALVGYGLACILLLRMRPGERAAQTNRGRLARWAWTLGWAAYLVHLGMAFHYYHEWSHARAVEHVEKASDFGPGIFFSHLFTLLWTVDVLWWWLRPATYAFRPAWIDRWLHGYMAFITFCGTVVYETGPIRWAGLALFTLLAALLVLRWREGRVARPLQGEVS
jgi:hypothetical protein